MAAKVRKSLIRCTNYRFFQYFVLTKRIKAMLFCMFINYNFAAVIENASHAARQI